MSRGGLEHLLKVVEHQEHSALADHCASASSAERPCASAMSSVGRNGRHDFVGRRDGSERDEGRAARVLGLQAAEQLDREVASSPCRPSR